MKRRHACAAIALAAAGGSALAQSGGVRLQTLDMQPVASSPQQLTGLLKDETAKWARVVKQAGIKTE